MRVVSDALGRVAAEQNFPYWTAHAAIQRGWLLLSEREGLAGFEEGIAIYRASGACMAVPTLLAMQAAAYLRHGGTDAAMALLREAQDLAVKTGERWYAPEIARLSGEALVAAGRREEAETEFRRAERFARRQGARLWHERALASLDRLRPGRRRDDPAHKQMTPRRRRQEA